MTPVNRAVRSLLHALVAGLIVAWAASGADISANGITVEDIPALTKIGIAGLVAALVALVTYLVTVTTQWRPTAAPARALKTFALTFLGTVSALWLASAASIAENGYNADDLSAVGKILSAALVAAVGALVSWLHNVTEDSGAVAPMAKA